MEIRTRVIMLPNKGFTISASPQLCSHFLNGKPAVRPVLQNLFFCLKRLKPLQNAFHSRLAFLWTNINRCLTKLAPPFTTDMFFPTQGLVIQGSPSTGPHRHPRCLKQCREAEGWSKHLALPGTELHVSPTEGKMNTIQQNQGQWKN